MIASQAPSAAGQDVLSGARTIPPCGSRQLARAARRITTADHPDATVKLIMCGLCSRPHHDVSAELETLSAGQIRI